MTANPSEHDSLFLARCSKWRWASKDTIELLNERETPIRQLSGWQTLVFNYADGSTTAEDIIADLRRTHPDKSEDHYRTEISKAIENLLEIPVAIECRLKKDNVDPTFDLPLDEQGGS